MINVLTPRPSKVLFIDTTYLKNTTEIDQNIDDRLLRTSIQYCQDKYILPLLGNNIFETWKMWISSGVTLQQNASYYFDADNLMLLEDFVQPTLAASCMMDLVYKISWQIRNKGVQEMNGEFSKPISYKQLDWLSESYREVAAFYAQRTTQFLMANPDIWLNYLNPQLGTSGNGADLYYPEQTKYFCGIHLPGYDGNLSTSGPYVGYGMSALQRMNYLGNE